MCGLNGKDLRVGGWGVNEGPALFMPDVLSLCIGHLVLSFTCIYLMKPEKANLT